MANSSEAVLARRRAVRVATIVGWIWFAFGFVRGKVGPVLNFWYAVALPYAGYYLLSYVVFDAGPRTFIRQIRPSRSASSAPSSTSPCRAC